MCDSLEWLLNGRRVIRYPGLERATSYYQSEAYALAFRHVLFINA